jgi:hypothetical protein
MDDLAPVEISCMTCRQAFTWTPGEQRFYATNGLQPPRRCARCRELRKRDRAAALAGQGEERQ